MESSEKLAHVERVIGHVFNVKLTGIESINTDSQPIYYEQQLHQIRQNDDLAIIGDKAIDLVLSIMWYRSYDSQDRSLSRGQMSNLKNDIASNKSLADCGFRHGLDAYLIKNAGHFSRISDGMMSTAVEATIGAVFKDSDCDLEAVRAVMGNLGFFDHPLLMTTNSNSLTGHPETQINR